MGESLATLVRERWAELWFRTGEHVLLTGCSTLAACAIGLPLGVLAFRLAWIRAPLMASVATLQTIPSLAMLACLLALLQKIGVVPALIALTLYALLPIVRNTLAGLDSVAPEVREAARGIGMTPRQQLVLVELPLATPVIGAGVRTAAVVGVGIATLSAFIGAGGLGQFINRGLALSNPELILLGAVPAAVLALLVDGSLASCLWAIQPQTTDSRRRNLGLVLRRGLALGSPVALAVLGLAGTFVDQEPATGRASKTGGVGTVRIGSKNFTEQLILGEMMALLLEHRAGLEVDRRFNLGGSLICHGALVHGEIDLYAEYTGTALTAILGESSQSDAEAVHELVAREYRTRFGAEWLAPFAFNNTYTITVRQELAAEKELQQISDLAPWSADLSAGFTAEFSERPDGYPGLRQAYDLRFRRVRDLDPALMYQAVARGEVDVICAFATDGRIPEYNLKTLADDRAFFPPYQAAPVVRADTLQRFPAIRAALLPLVDLLDDETMRSLNYDVDKNGRPPREVALEFLRSHSLVGAADSG